VAELAVESVGDRVEPDNLPVVPVRSVDGNGPFRVVEKAVIRVDATVDDAYNLRAASKAKFMQTAEIPEFRVVEDGVLVPVKQIAN
jgi:hypothetical protein